MTAEGQGQETKFSAGSGGQRQSSLVVRLLPPAKARGKSLYYWMVVHFKSNAILAVKPKPFVHPHFQACVAPVLPRTSVLPTHPKGAIGLHLP